MTTRRTAALLVATWAAGAVVATGVGVLAVRLVADQVGDPAVAPLPALAATPLASGSAAPGATTRPSSRGTPGSPGASAPPSSAVPPPAPTSAPPRPPAETARTFSSPGGSVGVACRGTAARLVLASPAAGWGVDEQETAGSEVEVRFASGDARVRLRVTCASGTPVLVERRVDDGGSGGDSDDGGQDDD